MCRPQFDFDNAHFTGEQTAALRDAKREGETFLLTLALRLAEPEGPLDEVSGPFLSSFLNSGSVFFGSPDSPFELEPQGQKSTFS